MLFMNEYKYFIHAFGWFVLVKSLFSKRRVQFQPFQLLIQQILRVSTTDEKKKILLKNIVF